MTLNVGPRSLNPLAAEFVPWFHKQQERKYTGWGREGFDTRAEKNYQYICFQIGPPTCNILDAPDELLHSILLKLSNPADVLATALTCKRMLEVVKEAELSLRVQNKQLEPSNHSILFPPYLLLPGIVELNLSGCESINNVHVMQAVRRLRGLRWMDLSACRKLSPHVIKRLCTATPHERSSELSRLQAIGLQRCFQLDSSALTQILLASSNKDSKLEVVTLSHLSLQDWPSNDTAQAFLTNTVSLSRRVAAHCVSWSSLKMLALNNCKKIAPDGLSYLTACCTELQMLFLGGSSMDVPVRPSQSLNASENPTGDQPGLEVRANGSSDSYHRRLASAVLDAVQPLANLAVLELTFFPAATIFHVTAEMPSVQVWDLSQAKFLEAAHEMKQGTSKTKAASNVSLALSAAVNCSSAARHTPLHAAVEADCKFSVKVVLELGGQLEAKDHSGATPLFCACEAGRLGSAVTLMAAGAELRTRNSAGEAPLYIAALKGHERVVEELLAEFKGRGLRWTESDLYGDGWSPLMAAALADRHAIAVRLLQSAGQEAWTLARAMNKHGQTAAHLAARKGSHMLLMALLNAGGRSIATIRDKNRRTPLDVALASGRDDAILLLKTAAASHGGGHSYSAKRTSGRTSKLQGHPDRHGR